MNQKVHLLIGGSEVALDTGGGEDGCVEVVISLKDGVPIYQEVVGLLHQFKGCQEAIGRGGGITVGVLLQGHNPTIEE